jgi:predicted aldo/keto reductase-like oxidoreductase
MAERVRNYSREFERRQARAKEQGWSGYRQQRRYRAELTDARVRELAAEIGGPVEPERGGSLMSKKANAIVNPVDRARKPADWQVRLLKAAGVLS